MRGERNRKSSLLYYALGNSKYSKLSVSDPQLVTFVCLFTKIYFSLSSSGVRTRALESNVTV